MATILLVTGLSGQHCATNLDLPGCVLLTVGGLALAAHRRSPVPLLAVTGLCAVGYQAAGFDVPAVAHLFAVYAATLSDTDRAVLAAALPALDRLVTAQHAGSSGTAA
ncbi:hypothetical protein KZZ52_45945 [Dactylosporangium sp. AC04546]|uniref:hypothetical protein n=1 Tax=Dactylosporangium sp. AC04546 TaxID=2862460 RepID=UPI001EDCBC4C|nr:hypothetical protein [Dactylosporangium sp. AC04546]WVK81258.1 hypothetical protein KZZ52_45945 [Dactylosporangium sp. AC04546]